MLEFLNPTVFKIHGEKTFRRLIDHQMSLVLFWTLGFKRISFFNLCLLAYQRRPHIFVQLCTTAAVLIHEPFPFQFQYISTTIELT